MLPIILDAASVAFRLFIIAYVLTHWKERSQQKSQKALPTLAARSAEPFCMLCKKMQYPEPPGGFAKKRTPCHGYGYCIGGQNSCSGIL